ncbi:MAG: hypothetical protein AAF639_41625 [Chloroflexota bacterium]
MTTITLDVPEYTLPLLNSIDNQLPLVLELVLSRLAPVSTLAYMETVALFVQMTSSETIANFRFSGDVQNRIRLFHKINYPTGVRERG